MNIPSDIHENVPLAPLTTLGVGGPARFFVKAEAESDVDDAFAFARSRSLPVFVLGGGSNIVVSDAGFDGLVIQVRLLGAFETALGEFTVSAGEDWDRFVATCVARGLAGVECLSGIPGTVGGTPVQNVGAYGQEVSETIISVRCYDRASGSIVDLTKEECGFTYRQSIFNHSHRDRYVVLSVSYRLAPGGPPRLVYRDLLEHFGGEKPSLSDVREAVLSIRKGKSMVIDDADPNSRSVGSFFKNPIMDLDRLYRLAGEYPEGVPHFPAGEGLVKVPAAWLIERAGFAKGYIHGNAGISTRHTLAIINRGGATATEIVELSRTIRNAVAMRFGIELTPEPVFIGEFPAKD